MYSFQGSFFAGQLHWRGETLGTNTLETPCFNVIKSQNTFTTYVIEHVNVEGTVG